LCHLEAVSVVSRDAHGKYALTPRGTVLAEDHPSGLRASFDLDGAVGRADTCFVELLHSIRTGEPCFPVRFGDGFWTDVAADPLRSASYDAQMGADVRAWATLLVDAFDWGSLDFIVDVGGGNGTLLARLLASFPNLRGTVFDQAHVVDRAMRVLTDAGVSDRADVVAGDFFERVPMGAGGYVLCAVLHDWDDERATAILQTCAAAAGTDGTILIVEKTGSEDRRTRTDMDLRVLAYFGGRERTAAELRVLAEQAGLRTAETHRVRDLAILELRTG
jgi:hypothetical protein